MPVYAMIGATMRLPRLRALSVSAVVFLAIVFAQSGAGAQDGDDGGGSASSSLDPCAPGCTVETCGPCDPTKNDPVCGNGIIEYGEECDAGARNGSAFCTQSCTYAFLSCNRSGCGCFQNGDGAVNMLGQVTAAKFGPDYAKHLRNNSAASPPSAANDYGFFTPQGIAVDERQHLLYIADKNNNRIVVHALTADNRIADYKMDASFGEGVVRSPTGIALDRDNNRLFVADAQNRRILVYDSVTPATVDDMDHDHDIAVGESALIGDVAVSRAGYLYVTVSDATDEVWRFNVRDGVAAGEEPDARMSVLRVNGELDAFSGPIGLGFDEARNELYVADTGNHRVLVFAENVINDPVAVASRIFGAGYGTSKFSLRQPADVMVHNDQVFIADTQNNRIVAFDADEPGLGAVSVLGQSDFEDYAGVNPPTRTSLGLPMYMSFLPGSCELLVSDSFNHRVMLFGDSVTCQAAASSSEASIDPNDFDIVSVQASNENTVLVEFNMPVEPDTLTDPTNYYVEGSIIEITNAVRISDRLVELTVAAELLPDHAYQLWVKRAEFHPDAIPQPEPPLPVPIPSGLRHKVTGDSFPSVNKPFEYREIVCFTPETPVTMADGSLRPIGEIAIDDSVRTFDPVTQTASNAKVNDVFTRTAHDLVEIVTSSVTLRVTTEHPFWVHDRWVRVRDLALGDELTLEDGSITAITAITQLAGSHDVVNLSVEAPHTFYAGGVLVHNKACGPGSDEQTCCAILGAPAGSWPCSCHGCPDGEVCQADGTCKVEIEQPPACAESSSPACGGTCQAGTCQAVEGGTCVCVSPPPPTPACAESSSPACGGTCPEGQTCQQIEGNLCGCIGPVCSSQLYPQCSSGSCSGGQKCKVSGETCACKSSCPFIYSWNGSGYTLENEAIPFSFMPGLEATTYAGLHALARRDDVLSVRIAEERDEISYIDSFSLIAIPKISDQYKVTPDIHGRLHTITDTTAAEGCTFVQSSCVASLQNVDEDVVEYMPDEASEEVVELRFRKPHDAYQKAKIVVNAETHLAMDVVAYDLIDGAGEKGYAMANLLLDLPVLGQALRNNLERNSLYLSVDVLTDDGWRHIDDIKPGNYRHWDDFMVTVDLSNVSGDELHIRLRSRGWYEINRVGVDWSEDVAINPIELKPISMLLDGMDMQGLLARADGKRVILNKNQFIEAAYDASVLDTVKDHDYVFSLRGYYVPVVPSGNQFSWHGLADMLMKLGSWSWVGEALSELQP